MGKRARGERGLPSPEAILAGRPGSWEADGVRNLLTSNVGHDEEHLLEHRTEALIVELDIDELLTGLPGDGRPPLLRLQP